MTATLSSPGAISNTALSTHPDIAASVEAVADLTTPEQVVWCDGSMTNGGPTNNWMDPVDIKTVMTAEYRGAMAGRTMYVIG